MKINKNDIEYIERHEIYGNYCKYIEPIIDYMCSVGHPMNGSDNIMEFIDSVVYCGYGFADYNNHLYIVELWEETNQQPDYDYFVEDGDKYILIPVE